MLKWAAVLLAALLLLPIWVPVALGATVYYALRYLWLVLVLSEWRAELFVKLVMLTLEDMLFFARHLGDGVRIAVARGKVVTKQYGLFKGEKMYLDVYNPSGNDPDKVVVFIYGGAWCSGGRWVYTLVAQRIAEETNATVVVPDYAYYPRAGMTEMAHQLYAVSSYVEGTYQGKDVYWAGHSAGAHLISLFFLRMWVGGVKMVEGVREELYPVPKRLFAGLGDEAGPLPLPPSEVHFSKVGHGRVKGLILVSGCYDIRKHLEWEKARGVAGYSGMKNATFGHFEPNSPTNILEHILQTNGPTKLRQLLADFPPTTLLHGSRDLTVSDGQSHTLHTLLNSVSVPVTYHHRIPAGHVDILTQLHSESNPPLIEVIKSVLDTSKGSPTASLRRYM